MSADHGSVLVMDGRTGSPVRIRTSSFPDFMRPGVWFENAYWRFSGMISEVEMREYLAYSVKRSKQPLPDPVIRRFALYVETFAKHMTMAAWIFLEAPQREKYEQTMRPVIEGLAKRRRGAKTMEDLDAMVFASVEAGFDPL